MKERVQLLDIAVDIVSTKDASDLTIQFLEDEESHVVYFISSQTLFMLKKEQEWKELVEESELILPATASVDASIDQVLGHKRDSFFRESYIDILLDYAIEMGYEMLIVAEDENKFISMQENIHEKHPQLTLSGIYMTEQEESLGHIVNEINSVAPEILLIALEEERQLTLLKDFRNQMNAGIMLFTGDTMYNQAVLESEAPESIQKLRIDNLYKWFRTGGKIKAFWTNFKMKIQLKQVEKDEKAEIQGEEEV
jgi:N-acetylglucosaminyldiphosphoundecaprenol N-acetyl-beta-D-mannosaminyltransferase